MTLKDQIAKDMLGVFLNLGEFAEEVTFWPKGDKFQARTIRAVLERVSPEPAGFSDGDAMQATAELTVSNDPVTGIGQVTKGKDKFLVALEEGATPEPCRVIAVALRDVGAWTVTVSR